MDGLVIKSTGSWYRVRDMASGKLYECRIKGKFRLKGLRTSNPVAVGDWVTFEPGSETADAVITELKPRRNYMIRKANKSSAESQIIASNLDQAFVVASLVAPRTSTGFLDRFLLTAEAYHIPAGIVFNKADLYAEAFSEPLDELVNLYRGLGYQVFVVSALSGKGMDELKAALKDKTTLFSGHSGVGKSTLLNAIEPGVEQKTQAVSGQFLKGKHTTTFAELFPLSDGGALIDTPGIREFGVIDLKPGEIAHYFPELRAKIQECRFNNCLHVNEPGCAVMEAVEKGEIDQERYYNYLSILRNEDIMQ